MIDKKYTFTDNDIETLIYFSEKPYHDKSMKRMEALAKKIVKSLKPIKYEL